LAPQLDRIVVQLDCTCLSLVLVQLRRLTGHVRSVAIVCPPGQPFEFPLSFALIARLHGFEEVYYDAELSLDDKEFGTVEQFHDAIRSVRDHGVTHLGVTTSSATLTAHRFGDMHTVVKMLTRFDRNNYDRVALQAELRKRIKRVKQLGVDGLACNSGDLDLLNLSPKLPAIVSCRLEDNPQVPVQLGAGSLVYDYHDLGLVDPVSVIGRIRERLEMIDRVLQCA